MHLDLTEAGCGYFGEQPRTVGIGIGMQQRRWKALAAPDRLRCS
jgi:hypothetical protein